MRFNKTLLQRPQMYSQLTKGNLTTATKKLKRAISRLREKQRSAEPYFFLEAKLR
jgi:hypothetical protein